MKKRLVYLMLGLLIFSPVSAFAAVDYSISYFDDINDYYAGKNGGSYSTGISNGYSGGITSNYTDYSGGITSNYTDYSGGVISGGSLSGEIINNSELGSDVIYDNISTPTTRLWSDEPLSTMITANQNRYKKKEKPISIKINGKKYIPRDTQPLLVEGRVFVPLRFVAEQLGYTISWDSENLVAEVNDGAILIEVGSYTMYKYDNLTIPTDTPPFLYQGTLMVGLRQIGAALNYQVSWNAKERMVTLDRVKPNVSLNEHNVFDRSKK